MTHYTVNLGDTLEDIAMTHGVSVDELYRRNCGTLEAAAKAHGLASSNEGTNLFVGTTLNVRKQAWL